MMNLFWPVYKNLEKEVLEISNQIHFDDNQTDVYSIKISELLLRCCVEIESISKEIYFLEGGKKANNEYLFFDTDCLEFLENKLLLSKKTLIISSINFHFNKNENKIIKPLFKANKRGSSSSDWKKAYMAIKHDRANNIKKANIFNLLKALGALYILNLYFKNQIFIIGKDTRYDKIIERFGSDVFLIKVHPFSSFDYSNLIYGKNEFYDECIYTIEYEDEYLKRQIEAYEYSYKKLVEIVNNKHKYIQHLKNGGHRISYHFSSLIDFFGFEEYCDIKRISDKRSIEIRETIEYKAILVR